MSESLPHLLVPPAWLQSRLGSATVRTVDLRDAEAFASGHIPGATHLEVSDLGRQTDGVDNVLLPPDEFADLMASHGISNGDAVIAYDDQWGLAAARLVWALNRYGHRNAAILDGGWDRWQQEDGPLETEAPPVRPGSFRAARGDGVDEDIFADFRWITDRVGPDGPVLLDTRSSAEYDRGHLPGAISWDWLNAVPVGEWNVSRDPDELRAEWQQLGFEPSDEVVVYCRSGMRASHTWVVLRAAGFERVRLYDGSWQEWSMKNPQESND